VKKSGGDTIARFSGAKRGMAQGGHLHPAQKM
jgi:hypothetical protein